MEVKFPGIQVKLVGEDGNAMVVIGRIRRAMRRANVPSAAIEAFTEEAMSGDYDHVLRTAMETIDVV